MGSFGGFYKGEKKKPKQNKKDKNTNSANIFAKPEYKFPTLVEKKRKSA